MRLDPDKFNALLNHLGQSFSWRRATACPCLDLHTGAPKANCAQCHGIGWAWGAAVTGTSGIASQKIQLQWAHFGLWAAGDVVLTVPSDSPLYAMGPFDRVAMLDSTEAFSFVRRRGIDDLQPFPVVDVDRVYWLTGPSQTVVEGALPCPNPDGSLSWSGTVPPSGAQYSISGRKRPEFFVFNDMAQDRSHHHGAALPRRIVLRKLDLLGRR